MSKTDAKNAASVSAADQKSLDSKSAQQFKYSALIQGLEQFIQFPIATHAWMFVVDGDLYTKENGPKGVETRDPGYVIGVLSGLELAISTITQELNEQIIKDIHKACMQNIKEKPGTLRSEPFKPGHYRGAGVLEKVWNKWATILGFMDLATIPVDSKDAIPNKLARVFHQLSPTGTEQIHYKVDANKKMVTTNGGAGDKAIITEIVEDIRDNSGGCFVYIPPDSKLIDNLMATIITEYNKAMLTVSSDREKRICILRLGQKCMKVHPFSDGNTRSVINCVLAREFIRHGFTVPIWSDPNVVPYQLLDELLPLVENGVTVNQQLVKDPDTEVFGGFKNSKLQREFRRSFSQVSTALLGTAKKLLASLKPVSQLSPVAFVANMGGAVTAVADGAAAVSSAPTVASASSMEPKTNPMAFVTSMGNAAAAAQSVSVTDAQMENTEEGQSKKNQ